MYIAVKVRYTLFSCDDEHMSIYFLEIYIFVCLSKIKSNHLQMPVVRVSFMLFLY